MADEDGDADLPQSGPSAATAADSAAPANRPDVGLKRARVYAKRPTVRFLQYPLR